MKISIITIVRNGMPFISQTIDSVLSQSYENIEYIVIDGNSSDATGDVVKSYLSDTRLCYICEADRGLSDAFNKGVTHSTGDYLLFLNSDDFLASNNALSLMVDEIKLHNYPEVIYGDCELLERASSQLLYVVAIEFDKRSIYQGKFFPHPSTFTKKTYFYKYGKFDENFKIAMDFEFFLRGLNKEKILHSNVLVTKIRSDGLSTRNQNLVIKEIISSLKKNGYVSNIFFEYYLHIVFHFRKFIRKFLTGIRIYSYLHFLKNK